MIYSKRILPGNTERRSKALPHLASAAAFLLIFHPPAFAQNAQGAKDFPVPVESGKVIRKELSESLSLFGNVRAWRAATVAAEVAGAVLSFEKESGDRVEAGEIVCRIDPGKYRIALDAARGELEKAQAKLQKALYDEERTKTLYEKKVASLELMQDRELEKKIAHAEVVAAQSAVDQAERNLGLTLIKAPYSGHLAEKYLQKGDWLKEGDKVFDIVDLSSAYVDITLPENEIDRIKTGIAAVVTLDAFPDVKYKGTVTRISPRTSPKNRGFTLRVDFEDRNGIVRDGLFARVEIVPEKRAVLMAPKDAIVERGPMKMVFRLTGDKAEKVEVGVLRQSGNMVEVHGDLKEGDEVAVTGNEVLRDGSAVNVTIRR